MLALSSCGSDANKLLQETFSGSHRVNSGQLGLSLTINPSGSKTFNSPISLSFGGPFESLGQGKLPQSSFTVSVSGLGRTGSLAIVSTGTNGYVTLQGTSYQLPAATFQRLESSFSQLTSSAGGSGSRSSTLSRLGIQPLHWLRDPSIVGTETVNGAKTTHIRAGINVSALLQDLNTFLQKAASAGVAGATRFPSGLSSSARSRIASELKNPTFDVWTGSSDKTLRKLAIKLSLPVSGQVSNSLGGLRAADVGLTVNYAEINQPQTITGPTSTRPFNEFVTKVRSVIQSLGNLLGGSGLAGTAGANGAGGAGTPGASGSAGASGTGGASAASVQSYSRCIQAAGNNIAQMQQCAPLLNNK